MAVNNKEDYRVPVRLPDGTYVWSNQIPKPVLEKLSNPSP